MNLAKSIYFFLVISLSLHNTRLFSRKKHNEGQLSQLFQDGERLDPSGKKIAPERNDNNLESLPIYNNNLNLNLVVTYWDKHNRLDDFKISFTKNIQNPLIKKIYIFYEKFSGKRPDFLESPKVIIIPIPEIAKHKDFYEFANQYLAGQIVIMANADIFFDESLKKLKYIDFSQFNAVLTRYNYFKSSRIPSEICHDTWIFRAPLCYKPEGVNYRFNCFGTEHLLVHGWVINGYKVINPCLSIFSYHAHKSDYRAGSVTKGFPMHPLYFLKMETLAEGLSPRKTYQTKPDAFVKGGLIIKNS